MTGMNVNTGELMSAEAVEALSESEQKNWKWTEVQVLLPQSMTIRILALLLCSTAFADTLPEGSSLVGTPFTSGTAWTISTIRWEQTGPIPYTLTGTNAVLTTDHKPIVKRNGDKWRIAFK